MQCLIYLLLASFFQIPVLGSRWRLYDASAYTECRETPKPPLYGGGIIINPEISNGSHGWTPFGNCALEVRDEGGSIFLAATKRKTHFDGPSQNLPQLEAGTMYTLSAWVQIKGGSMSSAFVKATLVVNGKSYICAGTAIAKQGCWSFLKGGFSLETTPAIAKMYFETANTESELWLDSVSLQPFTADEWRLQQKTWVAKHRIRKVRIRVVDSENRGVTGAEIQIIQTKMGFPFGSAISSTILNNPAYQKWFVERFNTATFENELKWYATEPRQGHINYTISDKMLAFCKSNGIAVRGHNIFWDDPRYTPGWVTHLNQTDLQKAVSERMDSVVKRYAAEFIQWDVVNEVMHYSFFEDKLGVNASHLFFLRVQEIDQQATLLINDYNIVESCNDPLSAVDMYVEKLKQFKGAGLKKLGIGLEGHFSKPINVPYMRAVLDKLHTLRLPIWLTEVDINNISLNNFTKAAIYLEEVLREGFSHPAVDGIVLWTALHPDGECYRMCLTDKGMDNLETGETVDALLEEWGRRGGIVGRTDEEGHLHMRGLMIGSYQVDVYHKHTSISQEMRIRAGKGTQNVVIQIL